MTSAKAWIAAIWGGVTGILSGLTVALVGDSTLQTLSQAQWLAVIVLGVAGFGGGFGLTWSTTNKSGEVTEAQAAAVLDKYTAPAAPITYNAPVVNPVAPVEAGGQGNGDIASS
jgi:hypothetical protein